MTTAKLYAFQDPVTGIISLSACHPDLPEWETNHIDIAEIKHNGQINKFSSAVQILSNVLGQAHIYLDTTQ